jgi:hypothetical protein
MTIRRGFLLTVAGCVLLSGCRLHSDSPTYTSCIKPPPVKSDVDRSAEADIAAKLEKLQASGELKGDFNKVVNTDYDKLSDNNAALLLFLEAIDCLMDRGQIGEAVARQMADIVRARWGAREGLAGIAPTLTPVEKNFINASPEKDLIYARLREFGIQ